MSLPELGKSVHVSGALLGKIEKAQRKPTIDLIARLDAILSTRGELTRLGLALTATVQDAAKTSLSAVRWADQSRRHANEISINTPAGQFFPGTAPAARLIHGQERGGRIELVTAEYPRDLAWDRRSYGLVVGAVERPERTQYFALAAEQLRRGTGDSAAVYVPRAYELDDFALGLLWAVTNLDDSLLDDDATLARSAADLEGAARDNHISEGNDRDLSHVSTMWLGSSYCARHILANAESLSATPQYWTAERSGEAASGWLLFRHKLDYLRRTAEIATGSTRPKRTFCLPPACVEGLEPPDRILLLLAAALVESFGIRVVVSVEDDLAAIPGFVLDRDGTAILANWINTDRTWQIDVRRDSRTIREFTTAAEHSVANDLIGSQAGALDRLRTLSEYLCIDWTWLRTRCNGFAAAGVAGLVRPRSRLLSLDGVHRACGFLAIDPLETSNPAAVHDLGPPSP